MCICSLTVLTMACGQVVEHGGNGLAGAMAGVDEPMHVSDTERGCEDRLNAIEGRVVDEVGEPVAYAAVVACPTLSNGVKVCIGPIRTDDDGQWAIEFEVEHQCVLDLSIRVTGPGADSVSVSCAMAQFGDASFGLGNITLPTVHTEWLDGADGDIGAIRLEATSAAGEAVLGAAFFASLDIDQVPSRCRQSEEVGRFAVYPNGPVDRVSIRHIDLPTVSDGVRVSLSVMGGLFTLVEDEMVGEGTFLECADGVVRGGRLTLDTPLPALGWVSIRRLEEE